MFDSEWDFEKELMIANESALSNSITSTNGNIVWNCNKKYFQQKFFFLFLGQHWYLTSGIHDVKIAYDLLFTSKILNIIFIKPNSERKKLKAISSKK